MLLQRFYQKMSSHFSSGHLGPASSMVTNKMQCFHCIPHIRKPWHKHQKYSSTLIISKVMFNVLCHQIVMMAILELCKLEKFPKVATLARGGFGCREPYAIQIHQKSLQYQPFLGSPRGTHSWQLDYMGTRTETFCKEAEDSEEVAAIF